MKPITYLEVDWIENDKWTKISEKDVYNYELPGITVQYISVRME